MNENSFQIGDRNFKVSKINAMKQYHIVRRISPILADFLPIIKDIAKMSKNQDTLSESEKFDQIAELAAPLLKGLSKLSDEDSNKVLIGLLGAVEMQQESGNWARLTNGDQLMFDNLDLPVMLQAAGRAFMYNMAGFFAALPRTS